ITYQDFTLQVSDPLEILTTSLPDGLKNEAYSEAIRLKGGIGPFTFSYAGQLPAGLTLNSATGIISGIPTAAGYVNVSITVVDSTYPTTQSTTQELGIRITSQLTILTSAVLPNGKKDVAINPIVLVAGGGPSPYKWAITEAYLPEGLSLNSQTGELSGTPADRGDFLFTIQVTDSDSQTAQKEFFWHISDDLTIVTGAVPDGAKGVSYSFTLEAEGGLLPYQWRRKSGMLPTGLSFNQTTGTIYGKPATRQTSSFTIEVNDSDNPAQTAEKTYIMEVLDDLYIYTRSLPNGRLNEAYTAEVRAKLGKPPYAWRLESGVLPPGLELTSSSTAASIEGTPTTTGAYVFTLKVSDNGTPVKYATQEYTVEIYGDVIIETTGLKCAYRGVPYSDHIVVSGGELPYTWRLVEGTLPAGLKLNSTSGHISGIANLVAGQSSVFKVRATDSGDPYAWHEKELVIYAIDPLDITTQEIQGALQKADYQAALAGEGGVTSYHWSIQKGSLPVGLDLDSATGVISGHALKCGTFDFTVQLDDSAPVPNTMTRAFNLKVTCCNDYDLSGNVSALEGVLMTLSGEKSGTATTDASGNYKFGHLTNGDYTITPSKENYWFKPESKTVAINNLDTSGVDFEPSTDTTPPTGSITINSGEDYTRSASAALSLSAADEESGLAQMQFSNDETTWSTPEAYTSTKVWTLTTGDGTKIVYVKFKDNAGNWSDAYSDTIILDATAPITTASPAGGIYYTSQTVALTANETAAIYYTTDGSAPTTDSTVYSSPIDITTETTLKFFAVDSAGNSEGIKTESYTIVYPLTVTKAGTGSGTVTSLPAGISCGFDCSETYTHGTVLTLTATPDVSSIFAGWSGACPDTETTCEVIMDAARSVTATFAIKTYTITSAAGTNGTITPTETVTVNHGANQTFTITPNVNYHAVDVLVDGTSVGAVNTYTFSDVTAGHTISATFAINTYPLTVARAGTGFGTVTSLPEGINCGSDCSETYTHGTVAILTATPAASSTFAGWSGACPDTGTTCEVTMDRARSVTATFTIIPLEIATTSLPGGVQNTDYSETLSATGGVIPYTWSIASGSLPTGLSLSTDGMISGTPTDTGTFDFTVQAQDSYTPSQSDTQSLSITINPQLEITTTLLLNGVQDTAYSQALLATGGALPYTWSLTAGSLPTGLSLSTGGLISGTPTDTGTFDFTIRITDSSSQSDTQILSIIINPPLEITTTSLPDAQLGTAYSQTLSVASGTAPYIWSISSGDLPAGLSLNSATGEISGTPATAGTSNFTVQAQDSGNPAQTDTQELSLTVKKAGVWIEPTPANLKFNLTTSVDVMVKDIQDLMGANITLKFDPARVEVEGVSEGAFLRTNNPDDIQFSSDYDNTTGEVTVSFVLTGGEPPGVSGEGILATLTFKAVAKDATSELTFDTCSFRDHFNAPIKVEAADGRFEAITDLLGGLDNDQDVDFEDYVLFVYYWNTNDTRGDIAGPISEGGKPGRPPWSETNYPYKPDGVVDFEDQMVFALMYNWYKQQEATAPLAAAAPVLRNERVVGETVVKVNSPGEAAVDKSFTVSISVRDVRDIMGAMVKLKFAPDLLEVEKVEKGEFLSENGGIVSLIEEIDPSQGEIKINTVVLGGSLSEISGSGELARVSFKPRASGKANISIEELKLRDSGNYPITAISEGADVLIGVGLSIPVAFDLFQNYPNPFQAATSISYQLPEEAFATLEVYNLSGQLVKTLVKEKKPAGWYSVKWDGRDSSGKAAASGVYLYRLTAGGFTRVEKMIILK
ncbi:MAG: putative Ig domain-containing protein, partial [bacterium]|nr:putative Ig domain-containing protein [bacterium]